jgi:PAS domain S-box-containing protein
MVKILIVEDESIVALELQSRLEYLGYSVCGVVATGQGAIDKTAESNPNIILMDINIKGPFDGVEAAERIKAKYEVPIIFLTAFSDPNTLQRAKITEPYGYITKPFEERELHTTIEIALYKYSIEKKLRDNERRLSTTLKSIGDAVIATGKDGRINYMNPAAEKLTSFSSDEAMGRFVLEVFNVTDKEIHQSLDETIKKLIAEGSSDKFPDSLTIISNTGESKIIESNAAAIKDVDSNISGLVLVFRDITEKFKAEAALIESEKKYKTVVENASEVIFALDLGWKCIYANAAAIKISGYSKEEISKLDFLKLILPSHRKYCKTKLMRQFLGKQKTTFIEYPFKAKSGKVFWLAQSNTLIMNDDKIVGFDIIARDITDEKLAEIKLNERNKFIETVLNNIQTGLVVTDISTGEIIYTNSKSEEIFRYSKEELKSFNRLLELEIPDEIYREDIKLKIFKTIFSRSHTKIKLQNVKITPPNEYEKHITLSIIPLHDQKIVIASIEDVSYQRKAEEQILQLSRAVEQSPVSVVILSVEGQIEYVNPKFCETSGFDYEEAIGKKFRLLDRQAEYSNEIENIYNSLFAGEEWKGEYKNRKKNGDNYWELISLSPIRSGEQIIHFLAVAEDITERKKMENRLKVALDKAEETSRLKSIFLGNMSHELRTPMVGILGFAQILKDELADPNNIEMVELLIKSGKRLLTTLESILEFSQLESKQIYINTTAVNLSQKVTGIIRNFNDRLKEKNLNLKLNFFDKEVNALVDERLFNQVLNNIIDNAIKFTPAGEITIVTSKTIENGAVWGILKISDTGIGISKEKQKIIFEDFRQASEGRTRSFEGNGLGLTVAKKIVEMMNGYITVESELGTGSQFNIYLPAVIPESEKSKWLLQLKNKVNDKKSSWGNNLPEILLVEDNEMNKDVVILYLKNICHVDYAKDGKTAVQMASQKKYPIVLMDINLGNGIGGIEAIKRIKEIERYKDVSFVALTGYAMHGDKEKLLEEGCTHYLAKPFLKEDLINLVSELVGKEIKSFMN